MPVEIRELVIKTEVRSESEAKNNVGSEQDLNKLKQQLLVECQRLIQARMKKPLVDR